MHYADTVERLQRYIDHELIFREKASESAASYSAVVIDTTTQEYINAEQLVNRAMIKYNIVSLKKVQTWSGLRISQMARDSGLHWDYDVLYSRLSEYEHSGPSSIVDYVHGNNISLQTSAEEIPLTLIDAIDYFLHCASLSAKLYGGSQKNVTSSRLHLDKLSQKYPG
jgi:hypothetical protein